MERADLWECTSGNEERNDSSHGGHQWRHEHTGLHLPLVQRRCQQTTGPGYIHASRVTILVLNRSGVLKETLKHDLESYKTFYFEAVYRINMGSIHKILSLHRAVKSKYEHLWLKIVLGSRTSNVNEVSSWRD